MTQTEIAAAAWRRASSASALTGNHWSGSRLLSAQRAFLMTLAHKAWSGNGTGGGGYAGRPAALFRVWAVGP
ncbi:MAG TPA: hypothetical protein VGS06_23675 [Streptosporangiaceae bacterium]|nr:hypothetical protein [Streptosporangiaceae bacterium]